jgi:hypothetical protein
MHMCITTPTGSSLPDLFTTSQLTSHSSLCQFKITLCDLYWSHFYCSRSSTLLQFLLILHFLMYNLRENYYECQYYLSGKRGKKKSKELFIGILF